MDIPAPIVKKRGPGRPRKEERRGRRGRKPNPDKLKAIAAGKKPGVNTADSKESDVSSETKLLEDLVKEIENKEINGHASKQQDEIIKPKNLELDTTEKKQDVVEETQISQSDASENKQEEPVKLSETSDVNITDNNNNHSDTLEEKVSTLTSEVEDKQDTAAELKSEETSIVQKSHSATELDSKTSDSETSGSKQPTTDLQKVLQESNDSLDDEDIAFMVAVTKYFNQRSFQKKNCTNAELNNSDDIVGVIDEDKVSGTEDEASYGGFDSLDIPKIGQDFDQMESITESVSVHRDYSVSLSEAPVRLKKCFVRLRRLTEEEINKSYPDYYYIKDDIRSKTEELVYKTEKAVNASYNVHPHTFNKERTKRRHKATENSQAFELYKRKREGYMKRRNNRSSFSENSLDYSQDEFRTYNSDGEKPRKKSKRGRKYERDFEWRPGTPDDTFNSPRSLRHNTTRTVIESDSPTSSDEEDILHQMYLGLYDDDDDAYKVPVRKKLPLNEYASTSIEKTSALSSDSFNNCSDVPHNKISNSVTGSNVSSSKSNCDSGDILSGIIANMNQLQRSKVKTSKSSSKSPSKEQAGNMKGKDRRWHWKRVSNSSYETDNKKTVATLLRELVNKVSSETKRPNSGTKKLINVCKWCHTHFPTSRKSDIWCAICVDQRKGGDSKSVTSKKKPSTSGKVKPFKENKVKKVNSTMSRVLKNLPQSEKQRLMYAEKTDKLSVEKGYSHCKSFTDPPNKSKKLLETSQNRVSIPKNMENNTPNSQSKISIKMSKTPVNNKISIKMDKTPVKPIKRKNSNCDNNNSNKTENVVPGKLNAPVNGEPESKQSKNCISLKKCTEGLFVMTFPDPDEELDLEGKPLKTASQQNDKASINSIVASSKSEQQLTNSKQFETYLFPPLPTVVVSNYCSDANSLNLSNTFFQNEITHQQALKNTKTVSPPIKSNDNMTISLANNPVTVSNAVSFQNSHTTPTLLRNNSPITITAIPLNNNVNSIPVNSVSQIQPITIRSMPVLNTTASVNNSNVSLLPVVTSVMTLADINKSPSKEKVQSLFSQENYVNSKQTEIRINNVTSLKTYEKHDSALTDISLRGITIMPLDSSHVSDCNQKKQAETSETDVSDKSNKRRRSNSDLSSPEYSEISKTAKSNEKDICESDNTNQSLATKGKTTELNTDEHKIPENLEESASKQSDAGANKENAAPQTPISAAVDMLGAISILAVIDLEKNPHSGLNCRIQLTKNQLGKLTSEKNPTPEHNEKIASCQYNLQLLNIAKKYLSLYGSFIKVSDHLLRKAQISQMIQIKKEIFEESTQQSSCMYSQSSKSNNSLSGSQSDLSQTTGMTPPVTNQIDNFNSGKSTNSTPINHIEKMQSQIAAMQNNVNIDYSQYGSFPSGGTVHHYPVEQIASLPPAIGAPTPVTPRNDCLMGESRETPSRGSGPRTPARPESAASQAEEQSLIQIKKEQFEAANSPPSQCAYSQNTNLTQISSQVPVISQVPTMPQHTVANTAVHFPVSTNQVYANQTSYSVQQSSINPNIPRTVSYTTNPNYSDVYLNVGAKHQLQISPVPPNPDMNQNRQVLLPQQMFIQNGSGLCSKQAVPSINNNQYVLRPPSYSSNTSGTVIVNNPQVGQQNALLTNVSNQQFYTSNQVSQLYYPQSSQITCMPTNTVSAVVTQDISATQIQQAELAPDQMLCAVCNSQATLRCKQCARVAYCNTTCAKTYWHQKHKMECKPLGS